MDSFLSDSDEPIENSPAGISFSLMPIGGDRLSPEDPGFTDLGGGSNQLDRAR